MAVIDISDEEKAGRYTVINSWCGRLKIPWIDIGNILQLMRKPKPTLLTTCSIFNLPHYIGMVQEELAFDDTVSYTQRGNGLQHS